MGKSGDEEQTEVNLNNVEVSEKQFLQIFEALGSNKVMSNLSLANTSLTDWAASNLCHALETNNTLLKVGLQFEYGDCQNRVAVHLQKNLDRIRIKRIAAKLAERENTGYFMYPSVQLGGAVPQQEKEWTKAGSPESEYEYYYSDEE